MNKTLALVALLGLVSAPAFAAPEASKEAAKPAVVAAEKMVKNDAAAPAIASDIKKEEVVIVDCFKAADKAACEKEQADKKAAEAAKAAPAAEAAPAAGKIEEKKM